MPKIDKALVQPADREWPSAGPVIPSLDGSVGRLELRDDGNRQPDPKIMQKLGVQRAWFNGALSVIPLGPEQRKALRDHFEETIEIALKAAGVPSWAAKSNDDD